LPSNAAAEKNGNSQNNAAANVSPQTTNAPNNGQKTPPSQPSRRKTPSVESFNTYSQNNSITPHPATVSSHLTDSELAAQYSLDENEMLNDELAPKYAENYAAESVPLTASLSKLDAVKIVIAILVIFFILFHTIKNMAIAEESEHAA